MSASLVLHCGAREVSRDELAKIPAPPATKTWYPLSHSTVLDTVLETLNGAGFAVARQKLGVMRDGWRFFGVLDLRNQVLDGVGLAVGVRNSIDKSFPIGFAAGSRVFVCDNLAFSAEVVVAKKHTRFGQDRFTEEMARIVQALHQYREAEAERIRHWQETELAGDRADALMLRAYERGLVSYRQLPQVIRAYREPEVADFRPRTAWSLLNAFTGVLRERQARPDYARLTMGLQRLLENGHEKGGRDVEPDGGAARDERAVA